MPDVVIIGCGGGGGVVAKELGELGIDVLVLEAGPWHGHPAAARRGAARRGGLTPEEDAAWGSTLDAQWNMMELNAGSPTDGYLRWGPSDRNRAPWQRHQPDNMFVWQLAGVGGTTQHYLGNCPRAYPRVFTGADDDGFPAETNPFPFSYEELRPYYEKVEETLPVSPAPATRRENVYFWGAKQAGHSYIGSQSGNPDHRTVLSPGYREQQNSILPAMNDLNEVGPSADFHYPAVTGCTLCNGCFEACPHPHHAPLTQKAKRSTLVSYVPMALATGKVEIRPNSFVLRILTEPGLDGKLHARGVVVRDSWTGEIRVIDAKIVVMAAGTIETPRLWMNSGLPDPTGEVGTGMTIHFYDWITGVFPFEVEQHIGQNSAARFDYPGQGGLEVVGALPAVDMLSTYLISMSGFAAHNPPEPGAPWDTRGRVVGEEFKRLAGNYTRLLSLLVVTDDEVVNTRGPDGQPSNGVGLAMDWPPDEHGMVPKITYSAPSRRSVERRDRLSRVAADILRAAGATEVHRTDMPPIVLHVHSTMRLGAVTDDAAETKGVAGVFIADNSVLPNGLGGPNPTLTTQALATRTAEKIAERYFTS